MDRIASGRCDDTSSAMVPDGRAGSLEAPCFTPHTHCRSWSRRGPGRDRLREFVPTRQAWLTHPPPVAPICQYGFPLPPSARKIQTTEPKVCQYQGGDTILLPPIHECEPSLRFDMRANIIGPGMMLCTRVCGPVLGLISRIPKAERLSKVVDSLRSFGAELFGPQVPAPAKDSHDVST